MKIFVTGGTGFIGTSVVTHLLNKKHDIYVLTRSSRNKSNQSEITYIEGDLKNSKNLSEIFDHIKPEVLIHLAWERLPDYSLYTSIQNLNYGIEIFTIAARSGCSTILSTGSCWEYLNKYGKLTEENTLSAENSFSAAKNSLRLMGKAVRSEFGFNFYWLRLFYVYGPNQRRSSLIPTIIDSFQKGHPPQINHPENKNDFIFVDDVARAITAIIEKNPQKTTYNIGSGHLTSIQDIMNETYQYVCKKKDLQITKMFEQSKSSMTEGFYADISRINSDTGWEPKFSIIEGIRLYYDYFTNTHEN